MKKVLITGISGFAGSFLTEYLFSIPNYQISGTYLTDSSLSNLAPIKEKINLFKLDLQDKKKTEELFGNVKPDLVFHLAALTSPAQSFENPSEFINNNIEAEVNLLEAIRKTNILPRVLIASSAEVYGNVSLSDLPIDEDTPFKPVSPYAVSKLAQDFLGFQYFISYKIPVIRIRPFNHIGPRQAPVFVVSSFSKKISEIEKRKGEAVLTVGNLQAKRDFTDVRDIVRGYVSLIEQGDAGEAYNIGSGRSFQISEILDKLLSLSTKKIKVEVDQKLLRPIDVPEFVCDNTKITKKTGWKPEIPIEKTLSDTLDYWRHLI